MSAFNLASRSPAPNSAAAQALLELTGRAPEEGALPVDALGYERRGYKEAGQVAGRSDDPEVLAAYGVGPEVAVHVARGLGGVFVGGG